MKPSKKSEDSPKIAVINIDPYSIRNSIKNTLHGVKESSPVASLAEKMEQGTICIIRQISRLSQFKTGVIGIWYYYDKADIEGKSESLWNPSIGWKYKLFMKPLVRLFRIPFFEEFLEDVPEQAGIKKSLKVYNLLDSDIQAQIQGAITIDFNDPEVPRSYLKAIIEEKKVECNIRANYKGSNKSETIINVYEFLDNLIGKTSHIKPNRGEESRNAPTPKARRKRSGVINKPSKKITSNTSIKNENRVEIENIETIDLSGAKIALCPDCGTLLRPKSTTRGISVLFCKECNKGYKNSPK